MRLMRELAAGRRLGFLSLVLFLGVGCDPDTADDDTTNTFVRVLSVSSEAGELDQLEPGTDLLSDVCFADEDHPPCTVINDNAVVTFQAQPKDLTRLSSPMNDIIFERYRVTYIRSDGRNVPGVDVPYAFDGVSTFTVPSDGTTVERGIIVVRHQAKLESPLRELTLAGSLLSVLARIEFFGRDMSGRQIKVTAFLNITFGDFANE